MFLLALFRNSPVYTFYGGIRTSVFAVRNFVLRAAAIYRLRHNGKIHCRVRYASDILCGALFCSVLRIQIVNKPYLSRDLAIAIGVAALTLCGGRISEELYKYRYRLVVGDKSVGFS